MADEDTRPITSPHPAARSSLVPLSRFLETILDSEQLEFFKSLQAHFGLFLAIGFFAGLLEAVSYVIYTVFGPTIYTEVFHYSALGLLFFDLLCFFGSASPRIWPIGLSGPRQYRDRHRDPFLLHHRCADVDLAEGNYPYRAQISQVEIAVNVDTCTRSPQKATRPPRTRSGRSQRTPKSKIYRCNPIAHFVAGDRREVHSSRDLEAHGGPLSAVPRKSWAPTALARRRPTAYIQPR